MTFIELWIRSETIDWTSETSTVDLSSSWKARLFADWAAFLAMELTLAVVPICFAPLVFLDSAS